MAEAIKRRRNYSKIALSYDESKTFLDSEVWLRIATLDSAGEIWNLPTHFVRIGDEVYFDEAPESTVLKNIEKYNNVCGVVDTGYSYDDLVGVILQGEATVVSDKDRVDEVAKKLTEKYTLLTRRPPVQDFATRKIVKVKPYQGLEVLSWNFGRGHL